MFGLKSFDAINTVRTYFEMVNLQSGPIVMKLVDRRNASIQWQLIWLDQERLDILT